MQPAPSVELPDDVLIGIIASLRDMQPVLNPLNQHQARQGPNMLLVMMRVSSRLHNLIIPFIYTPSIIITEPAKFFYGINLSPPTGCIGKAENLKLIKQIKFAYPSEPPLESEELHQGDWNDVSFHKHCEHVMKQFITALDQVEITTRYLREYKVNANGKKLLKNVSRLSFLPMSEWVYEKHHSLINSKMTRWGIKVNHTERIKYLLDNRSIIVEDFQQSINETMASIHICDHSSHGPYSWSIPSSKGVTPITYTTEIGRHHIRYRLPIPILPSSTTRLIIREETLEKYEPREEWFLSSLEIQEISIEGFLKWFRGELTEAIKNLPWSRFHKDIKEFDGQTRIIVYIPTETQALKSVVGKLRPSISGRTAQMSSHQLYKELSRWLTNKKYSKFNLKNVKVDIALWKEKGDCPACSE